MLPIREGSPGNWSELLNFPNGTTSSSQPFDATYFLIITNLLNILSKSLSQDVDERFQSAEEFLGALNGESHIKDGIYEKFDVCSKKVQSDEKVENIKKGNDLRMLPE